MRKRDRHGRGIRGPLALDNRLTSRPAPVRLAPSRVDYFLDCLDDSIARIESTCPDAIRGVDIGIEPVPSPAAMRQGMNEHNAIPLAGAIDSANNSPARVILYERPIEHRAVDREDLATLVHRTLVEQLASLTGHSILEIDPHFEDDW